MRIVYCITCPAGRDGAASGGWIKMSEARVMPSITNLLFKDALNQDAPGNRPAFEKSRCIAAKQNKAKCDACAGACPVHAIGRPEKGEADMERCVGCGVCAAVCPGRAWSAPQHRYEKTAHLLADGRNVHLLGCKLAAGDVDARVWCLASLEWETIAALALVGRVELLRGECAQCERAACLAEFERTLERVRRFLGEERFAKRVRLLGEGEAAQRAFSRRDLFTALIPGARGRAAQDQQSAPDFGKDARALPRMLAWAIDRQGEGAKPFGFDMPELTQRCWACGICARMCPTGAIAAETQDGVWQMAVSPALCTGCGVCAAVCPEGAVDGIGTIAMAAGQRRVVYATRALSCEGCGGAVKPQENQTLCLRCRAKNQKKRP